MRAPGGLPRAVATWQWWQREPARPMGPPAGRRAHLTSRRRCLRARGPLRDARGAPPALPAVTRDEVLALRELYAKLSNELHQVRQAERRFRLVRSACRRPRHGRNATRASAPTPSGPPPQDNLIHKDEFMWALFKANRDNLFAERVRHGGGVSAGWGASSGGLWHPACLRLSASLKPPRSTHACQVFTLFDIKHNHVIEFGEFVRSLSVFHPKAPLAEKAKCEGGARGAAWGGVADRGGC